MEKHKAITSLIFLLTDFAKSGIFQRLGGLPNRRTRFCNAILEPARTQGSSNPFSATERLSSWQPICSKSTDNLSVQYPLLPLQVKHSSSCFNKYIASSYLNRIFNIINLVQHKQICRLNQHEFPMHAYELFEELQI